MRSLIRAARLVAVLKRQLTTKRRRRCRDVRAIEYLERRELLTVATGWEQRGVGGGGSLFSPSINPHDPNEIFVSSDMSNLFRTADAGATWETLDFRNIQGGPGSTTTGVQYTSSPDVLYALDRSNIDLLDPVTPSRSIDGGRTWTRLAADPTNGGAFHLAADFHDPNRLLVSDYRRLYLSIDGGQSFREKYFTQNSGAGLHIGGVFFDGADIYVGTNEGLIVSSDNGATFELAPIGGIESGEEIISFAGAREGDRVRLFAVTYRDGGVYAGVPPNSHWAYRGVYRLDPDGGAWQAIENGISGGAHPVFVSAALDEVDVISLAGGSAAGVPTVFRTTDSGDSWNSVLHVANNANVATGWSGDGGDRGWTYGENAMGFAVSPSDPDVAVLTDFGFAHMTTDGGATWQALYVNPADRNPAGSDTPRGATYRSSGLDNTSVWDLTWATEDQIVGAYSDIRGVRSDDGGVSWSFDYTGHTQNSMYRSIRHANGQLYAATATVHDLYQSTHLLDAQIDRSGGRVLASPDNGRTWRTLHDFGAAVVWVADDPSNPERLYASVAHSSRGGIWVSDDIGNGENSAWRRLPEPPRTEGHAFNLHVLNDGTLVSTYSARRDASRRFTPSSGVFVSTDGGQTWLDRSDAGMRYWTKDVTIDPHDPTQSTWYASVFSGWGGPPNGLGGLYRTMDRGVTWTRISDVDRVNSATLSPTNSNELYFTSEVDGLWFSDDMDTASPTFSQVGDYPFRQPMRVFFNPYDASEVWVTSFGGGLFVGRSGAAPTAMVQFTNASFSVDEYSGSATITATRTGSGTGPVSVDYSTTDGTALNGVDYLMMSGTLSWLDGETGEKSFSVPVTDDLIAEADETVLLSLSNARGATLNGGSAVLEIRDDDPVQFLNLSSASFEAAEGDGTIVLTVVRSGSTSGTVSVDFRTRDMTAVAEFDYSSSDGTLHFADGQDTATIAIPIIDDADDEDAESFLVELSNPSAGAETGVQPTAEIHIADNDVATGGTIEFYANTYRTRENWGYAVIYVNRTGDTSGTVAVEYVITPGTATPGRDYAATRGTLMFADGERRRTFHVPLINDHEVEPAETVHLTLTTPTNGARLGDRVQAVLTIRDDDVAVPGTLQLSRSTRTTRENWGYVEIYVTRTNGLTGAVSVDYATSAGSARAGSDYRSVSGTLTFADGQRRRHFRVPLINDRILEDTETLHVTLTGPTAGATLGTVSRAVVSIRDDEVNAPGTLQLSSSVYRTRENWGYVEVYVRRTSGLIGTISIDYEVAGITAVAGEDFVPVTGTLTFQTGEMVKSFRIPLINNRASEPDETLSVSLLRPTGGAGLGERVSGLIRIQDDD